MADIFIFSNLITAVGNGVDMTMDFQYLYVDAGATLGTTAIGGRAVRTTASSPSIEVAGRLVGAFGVEFAGLGGDLHVMAGGSVAGTRGIRSDDTVSVQNEGSISGGRAIYSFGGLVLSNAGTISGGLGAVFVEGDATIINTGLMSAPGTANFVGGKADISNFGVIAGGVSTQGQADVVVNRGIITGNVQMGSGDDLLDAVGGQIGGQIFLGDGADTFWGGDFAERVDAGTGQDEIDGGGGNDRFVASDADGRDDIDGGAGIDTYDARLVTTGLVANLTTGDARTAGLTDLLTNVERVFSGAGNDRLTGDGGANVLRSGAGNDVLAGLDGDDVLWGDVGRDNLFGGNGNDRLLGGDLIDTLDGGAGNDRLQGSYDVDVMTGGTGSDRFVFEDFDEFISILGAGLDRITDLAQGSDVIDLSGLDAVFATAGDQAFSFVGTGAITAFGQLNYRTTAGSTIISIGFNTPAAFDVIRLDGVYVLTAADFQL